MPITLTPALVPASGTQSAPCTMVYDVAVVGATEPVTYLWNFGDGNTATTKSGSHLYVKDRNYPVTVSVRDAIGLIADATESYVVDPELVAAFTASVVISPGGSNEATIANATTGGTAPFTYLWEWGDGTTDSNASPAPHAYAESGYYSIKLTVTDTLGHVSRVTRSVAVQGSITVAVTATLPAITSAPVVVDFAANATQGTGPYTYLWKFGDGTTATGPNVSHTYTTHGTFEVEVQVVDGLGHDAGGRVDVTVLEFLTSDPDRIPEKGVPVLPVTFYAHTVGGKKPYTYLWDFQDGDTSTEANPKHNFTKRGFYNVTVQVTDAQGSSHTMVCAVDVDGTPPPPPGESGITIYQWGVTIYGIPFTIYGNG